MIAKRPFRVTARYLVAVGFIYMVTACAWLYLGKVTQNRTNERDYTLRAEVGRLWGGQHNQVPPGMTLSMVPTPRPAAVVAGQPPPPPPPTVPQECQQTMSLEPRSTDAKVKLALEHRRKGLLWYSTYGVRFDGAFAFSNKTPCERRAQLWIPLPAQGAIYDAFTVEVDGVEVPVEISTPDNPSGAPASTAVAKLTFKAGQRRVVRLSYSSRGMDRWSYSFGANTARARNFSLTVETNFDEVDFPAASLSPSDKRANGDGWLLSWRFGNLLADASVAVDMPQKLNPGPLSSEISRFAPVSLFFFFFVLLLVSVLKQVRLHPVHYGLLAAAFFAFHLLMAYMVDHMPLGVAFAIASVTSVGLVVSYLRLAVGARFAMLWAGGAQLLYLVLFSLAFFLEGYTGLTITIFSVLTLFVVMQLTGRIDWAEKLSGGSGPMPEPAPPGSDPTATPEPAPPPPASDPAPVAASAGDLRIFSRVE